MDYRVKDGDVCMSDAMPFCQEFRVRTVHALEECIKSKTFLMNVRHRFQAGDTLTVYRFANENWGEVVEVCKDLVVRLVDNEGVDLIKTADVIHSGSKAEDGIVVTRGFRGRFVVRIDGATVKEFNTAVEADEYAEMLAVDSNKASSDVVYYSAAYKKQYGQTEAA